MLLWKLRQWSYLQHIHSYLFCQFLFVSLNKYLLVVRLAKFRMKIPLWEMQKRFHTYHIGASNTRRLLQDKYTKNSQYKSQYNFSKNIWLPLCISEIHSYREREREKDQYNKTDTAKE
jgi:hypothetical protein